MPSELLNVEFSNACWISAIVELETCEDVFCGIATFWITWEFATMLEYAKFGAFSS